MPYEVCLSLIITVVIRLLPSLWSHFVQELVIHKYMPIPQDKNKATSCLIYSTLFYQYIQLCDVQLGRKKGHNVIFCDMLAVTSHWRKLNLKSLVFINESDMLGATHAVLQLTTKLFFFFIQSLRIFTYVFINISKELKYLPTCTEKSVH